MTTVQVQDALEPLPAVGYAVLSALLVHGSLSRPEVGERTGLSPASVTRAVRPLLEGGYLQERELEEPMRTGRPVYPLEVNASAASFVGLKLTEDQVFGVRTDLRGGLVAQDNQQLTSKEPERVVEQLASLVRRLSTTPNAGPVRRVGVAVSGDVDQLSGVVRYSPFLDWRDVPLAAMVEDAVGHRAVLENDVRALTVAEQWFGAGRGCETFAVVTVGAGIGCGLVVDGRVVRGAFGTAAELGHVPVADDRALCPCGATGCVQAVASSPAIVAAARAFLGSPRSKAVRELDLDAVARLAREGDERMVALFERAGRAIGLAVASVANLVGPQRILVSGEGVSAIDLLEPSLRRAYEAQCFASAGRCEVVIDPLPFREWAHGAAAVALRDLVNTA